MKTFLIIGKTGVGKSSLINSLFGTNVCRTSEYEACTEIIEYLIHDTPWGKIKLIDTPGLCDNNEKTDFEYLNLIIKNVDIKKIHSVVYVSRLDDTRFRSDEKFALKNFTLFLGPGLWKNTILMYTFASNVKKPNDHANFKTKQIVDFCNEICILNNLNLEINVSMVGIIDNINNNWITTDAITLASVFK